MLNFWIHQQITTELRQHDDFEVFLNKKIYFDNREWTYGQFLYKHCFDKVQDFTYKCEKYVDRKPVENFGESEKKLAQKVDFLFSNHLRKPDVFENDKKLKKLKELDMFDGDKEKESFYLNLFTNSLAILYPSELLSLNPEIIRGVLASSIKILSTSSTIA